MRAFLKVLKAAGIAAGVLVLIAAARLAVLTVTEYRPAATETVIAGHGAGAELAAGTELTAVTWNTGYGALGDNADFFMDGGSSVYTADKARVEQNLSGIRDTLRALSPDFALLQEVDINSSRSYGTDTRAFFRDAMPGSSEAFAYNFNFLFVPYPLPPIGHVESGLFTLSRAEIASAERVSLPCPFS